CNKPCAGGESCQSGKCVSPTKFPGSLVVSASEGDQINSWIGSPSQMWTLCYRRTLHGANSVTFHNNCNGKGPSVVVASLNTGRKIGAYVTQSWSNCSCYVDDNNAFLFSLTNGFKHTCGGNICGSCGGCPYEMYCNSSYGPTFGAGHDWYITSDMTTGYCNLGYTYNCRVSSYGNAACQNDFCGSYNGWNITELEVWVK
ncbi:MAG: TLD domain-containing protein, partial [Deltaproteobacteria bacterium]|nr:TLD domain-containing protein [Deltaproteobacteria bacterium]